MREGPIMAPVLHPSDVGTALALAVISASQAPLLLLDGDANIVAASESFLHTFGLDDADIRGRLLFSIGAGEWDMRRLRSLLSAVASGGASINTYEIEMVGPADRRRSLILNAERLHFTTGETVRIMLTVVDGTEARAEEKLKNDLIRDKDILLREIQHRVANSLQIIASVLLQNAKKVSSEESRTHLRDAHQRVMSVAAVQRQLAQSSLTTVPVTPYLTQLCQSIGASMIERPDLVTITVNGDATATSGETSVSLGLIVTELVINALKHAFPDERHGVVTVNYQSKQTGWALSVSDDGIGMPAANDGAKAGLGTAIIQALATQLAATITVTDLGPGTGVSVVHKRPIGSQRASEHASIRAV